MIRKITIYHQIKFLQISFLFTQKSLIILKIKLFNHLILLIVSKDKAGYEMDKNTRLNQIKSHLPPSWLIHQMFELQGISLLNDWLKTFVVFSCCKKQYKCHNKLQHFYLTFLLHRPLLRGKNNNKLQTKNVCEFGHKEFILLFFQFDFDFLFI